jgi:hypothetical protein
MVKLKEVEDEHFAEKPVTTKGDTLLESEGEDDDDYTDTGMPLDFIHPHTLHVHTKTSLIASETIHLHTYIHPLLHSHSSRNTQKPSIY